ncbi:transcription factor cwo-like isoform X1 [Centruroides sculpturatus]|uniref:transcription factor cwo-like isoform X1 n=2 Tax=Centruroides sculpturatus TaxID=218467 RepID=UPI000C6D781C|nr:transcription factor cwo-like isoform X1 [Centruroides sculpturatus]
MFQSLNFATIPHEEDDFGYSRKKTTRDPMSHRIIEKRRRDRMNNCLADLSRLIPTAYLKKGRGRIEKTEIIEMAIKHLKHLQAHSCKDPNNCEVANAAEQDRKHQYRLGFQECMSETVRFLVEIEGVYAGDGLCVRLVNHLQKHFDKIVGGMGFNQHSDFSITLAEESRDTSMDISNSPSRAPTLDSYPPTPAPILTPVLESSVCHHESSDGEPPKMVQECGRNDSPPTIRPSSEGGSQLREMLQNPGLPKDLVRSSTSYTIQDHKSDEVYKFKNNIKHRFNADLRHHTLDDDKSHSDSYSPQSKQQSLSQRNLIRSTYPAHSTSVSTTSELTVKIPERIEGLQNSHWENQADCGSSSCGSNPSPPSIARSNGSSSGYSTGGDISYAPRLRSQLQGRHSPTYLQTSPENVSTRSPSPSTQIRNGVPIFALHPKGTYYIPLTIDASLVSAAFIGYEDIIPVLHPVSISVNFCRQLKVKINGMQPTWEYRPFVQDKYNVYTDSKTNVSFGCGDTNHN